MRVVRQLRDGGDDGRRRRQQLGRRGGRIQPGRSRGERVQVGGQRTQQRLDLTRRGAGGQGSAQIAHQALEQRGVTEGGAEITEAGGYPLQNPAEQLARAHFFAACPAMRAAIRAATSASVAGRVVPDAAVTAASMFSGSDVHSSPRLSSWL